MDLTLLSGALGKERLYVAEIHSKTLLYLVYVQGCSLGIDPETA
jgi:hypothetical protein